jgi:hypothetical protein
VVPHNDEIFFVVQPDPKKAETNDDDDDEKPSSLPWDEEGKNLLEKYAQMDTDRSCLKKMVKELRKQHPQSLRDRSSKEIERTLREMILMAYVFVVVYENHFVHSVVVVRKHMKEMDIKREDVDLSIPTDPRRNDKDDGGDDDKNNNDLIVTSRLSSFAPSAPPLPAAASTSFIAPSPRPPSKPKATSPSSAGPFSPSSQSVMTGTKLIVDYSRLKSRLSSLS